MGDDPVKNCLFHIRFLIM